jgi:hypothetical protein
VSFAFASSAQAHFPWLALDKDNRVVQYFGETVAQRDYKLPEKIATAEVFAIDSDGNTEMISMENVEQDGFIGRRSEAAVKPSERIESNVTYGIHGGSRLDYYSSHVPGTLPKAFSAMKSLSPPATLQCWAIDSATGVTVRVLWNNKPLSDTEVKLYNEHGAERTARKTNADGDVEFSDAEVEEGLNAVLVGVVQKDQEGTFDDRKYQSASHYLTMTFRDPEGSPASEGTEKSVSRSSIPTLSVPQPKQLNIASAHPRLHPDLPLPLTSFGAVRHGSTIFVYGGHTGEAHHYSTLEQSDSLLALDLDNRDAEWKKLSAGRRLQGLGLVAYGNRIIRIGGFEAMNGLDDDHDLRSTNEVLAFDLEAKSWKRLPDLPEPRSSHDAIVVGDRLYVIGGWTLRGTETDWLSTAWSIQLPAEGKAWEALPSPPFSRRAIALAATQNQIYVIGGMNEKGGPTTEVSCYDTAKREWRSAPSLQGQPMNGFGAAAWHLGDNIIATTSEGDIQELRPAAQSWEIIGKVQEPRFFHRLLPYGHGKLVALGGVNMHEQTKLPNLEIVSIP